MRKLILCVVVAALATSCSMFEELGKGGDGGEIRLPDIEVLTVSDVSATVYVGEADFDGLDNPGVICATSPGFEDSTYIVQVSSAGPVQLNALTPETTYYVCACAYADNGDMVRGNSVQFTTDKAHPHVELVSFYVYEQVAVVELNAWGPGIQSVGVCWNDNAEPNIENDSYKEAVYDADRETYGVEVMGLDENRSYALRGYVVAEDGKAYYSDVEENFTTEYAYVPDMDIERPIEHGDTYAVVTYYVNEDNIVERGLCWGTQSEPTIDDFTTKDEPEEGYVSVRLENLQPETEYYVRPYAVLVHPYEGEKIYYGWEYSFTTYELDEYFEIPDAVFAEYLLETGDKNGDGKLSKREASSITMLNMSNMNITSLQGIEYCTGLRYLYCDDSKITSLDLSQNTELVQVQCENNSIAELKLGDNSRMTILSCGGNKLISLDVSTLPALEILSCNDNMLRSLDVSANTELRDLNCANNNISSLDVSNNRLLEDLYCGNLPLTSLDVSGKTNLTRLDCYYNESMTSLDVTGCTALSYLHCRFCKLTSLDLSTNSALTDLDCGYNKTITDLNISGCNKLVKFDCGQNKIKSLDLSDRAQLTSVMCGGNELAELNVTGCSSLQSLQCNDNQLTSLDLSGLAMLDWVSCGTNKLTSLNLSGAIRLMELYCNLNALASLDVSDCTYLTDLDCGRNNITSLDLRNNPDLTPDNLTCDSNVNVVWE